MNRKKITIIINSEIFVRNYLCTEFIDKKGIEEITILRKQGVDTKSSTGENNEKVYAVNIVQKIISSAIFKIELLRKLNKSKTFKFRLKRILRWPEIKKHFYEILEGKSRSKHIRKLTTNLLFGAISLIMMLVLIIFLPISRVLFINLIKLTGGDIEKSIKRIKPDIIIFPFAGYEVEQNYLPNIAKKINAKIIFCTDNWDNLSSKTVIAYKPDLITVIGEQSKNHAQNIHGIDRKNILISGSPRFSVYKNKTATNEYIDKKVIGFVGSFLEFDEIEALEIIEEILNQIEIESGEHWKINYRPHPWRMGENEVSRISRLKRMYMTDEFENKYYNNEKSVKFQPDLDRYVEFFDECAFVVGGLTTMMLEALMAKKRFLALSYWDKRYNLYSPGSALENYEHFIGIEELKNVVIIKDKSKLNDFIRYEIKTRKTFEEDKFLNYFVSNDCLTISKLDLEG